MKQDKDNLKLTSIEFGKQPDLDFPRMPKLQPPKKRKRRKFWSPFSANGDKPNQSGSRYYKRQMRKVKRDVSL